MATIIDSLIITLGLDPSKYKKGQQEVAAIGKKGADDTKKYANEIEKQNKRAAESFANIKKEALGLFAVIIGANGIKDFTQKTVASMVATSNAAHAMGQAVGDVAAFGNMIKHNGGNAEAATQSLMGLSQAMQRFKSFGEINLDMQRGLGMIGALDPNLSAKQVFDRFANWSTGKKGPEVEQVGQMLGFDQDIINEAMKGGARAAKDFAEAKKRSITEEKSYDSVRKLLGAFQDLRQELAKDGAEMLTDFSPALINILNTTRELAQKFPEVAKGIMAVVIALGALKGAAIGAGLLRALTGGAAAAGGAEAAAGGAAAAGGPLAALAGLMGLPILLGAADGAFQYQSARHDPRAASDADLAAGMDYARSRLKQVPDGPAGASVRADLLSGAFAIQKEMDRRMAPTGGAAASASTGANGDTAGINNNNPGNIRSQSGGFMKYKTLGEGINAMHKQLLRYQDKYGLNTISEIVNRWAPPSENDTAAYIRDISKYTGFGPNQSINLHDPAVLAALQAAMIGHETGNRSFSAARLLGGRSSISYHGSGVNIGTLNIYAKDGSGREIVHAIRNKLDGLTMAASANQGLV